MLIDLDHTPPSRPAPPRRFRGPKWVVPIVLALSLGGAQVPAEARILRPSVVSAERAVTWMLHDGVFYSLHSRPQDGVLELQARRVPSSDPLWTRMVDAAGEVPRLRMAGPYLALRFGAEMLLLDVETGRARWQDDDNSTAWPAGDDVLLWTPEGRIGLLDAGTGSIRWRKEVKAEPIGVTGTERHVQVLYDDGSAVAYGRETGEVANTVAGLAVRPAEIDGFGRLVDDGLPALMAMGDLAIVFSPDRIAALRLPTLEQLWTARLPLPAGAARCGERLCVLHGNGMTAFDQNSGAPLWSGTEWTTWSGTLAGSPAGRVARVDPDTGRVVRDLGMGRLSGSVLIRTGGDRTGVFDQVSGDLRAIIPAGFLWCDGPGDQISCQGAGSSVTVWRIPKT
ncbi:PQQ-binding-like beta-propeller repeat protein [Actinoplanes couchii]|uniref:Pyrrolo-quinoline quinone repeat domain-containing protein n=1 Tax=Actinoplanes couchii TaxID=403638 RepID=A0ABQ3X3K5_9ACTN|nr:PQQ-binding-like beta-propeller repeat protein [Actinoplanes couchii]MDR6322760.1 outer membrane protein assembly factor BamB [Actinoplanes couchii]GID52998.1 hypothetical protein Aco03nite_014020 [Actinoplanes couchii]